MTSIRAFALAAVLAFPASRLRPVGQGRRHHAGVGLHRQGFAAAQRQRGPGDAGMALVRPTEVPDTNGVEDLSPRAPGPDLELRQAQLRRGRGQPLRRRTWHRPGLDLPLRGALAALQRSPCADHPRHHHRPRLPRRSGGKEEVLAPHGSRRGGAQGGRDRPRRRHHRVRRCCRSPADARACYVMAHGAGAGMTHPFLGSRGRRAGRRGVATLRYQFPSMERGSQASRSAGGRARGGARRRRRSRPPAPGPRRCSPAASRSAAG